MKNLTKNSKILGVGLLVLILSLIGSLICLATNTAAGTIGWWGIVMFGLFSLLLGGIAFSTKIFIENQYIQKRIRSSNQPREILVVNREQFINQPYSPMNKNIDGKEFYERVLGKSNKDKKRRT